MTTTQLSQATLAELPVQGPEYDRSQVTAGVVHFGVGGFHRAHQALYIDKLMRQGEAMDFGIIGMGVMPSDIRMRDADRKSTRLNSSHIEESRMPSSA